MKLKSIRSAICLILVLLYFAGLVCMFIDRFSDGLFLWGMSTIAGIFMLWAIRRKEDKTSKENNDNADEA